MQASHGTTGGNGRRLLVFDLDGTLIDSRRDIADATNAVIVDLGGTALDLETITRMVGEGAAVLMRRALAAAKIGHDRERWPEALERFLVHYDARLTAYTRPYAGIPEALSTLRDRGHALAVLTNKPQDPTTKILERLDLARYFGAVIGGDTSVGRKPDPGGMQQLIAQFGATPQETVMIGDSPVDLDTARRAGTAVCLARYGFGFRFTPERLAGDELFVDDARELVAVLSPSS